MKCRSFLVAGLLGWFGLFGAALAPVAVLAAAVRAQGQVDAGAPAPAPAPAATGAVPRQRPAAWPAAVVDAVARIPVQEQGRIKPLSTFAAFHMLALNGKRSFETPWGERLGPVEWFLDCVFYPQQAEHYRIVRLEDTHLLDALKLSREELRLEKRSDRVSIAQLRPGIHQLQSLAEASFAKESHKRSPLEVQALTLSQVLPGLFRLLGTADFALARHPVAGDPILEAMFAGRAEITAVDLFGRGGEISARQAEFRDSGLFAYLSRVIGPAQYLAFLPPAGADDEVYLSIGDVMLLDLRGAGMHHSTPAVSATQAEIFREFGRIAQLRDDFPALGEGLIGLQERLVASAAARGEFAGIDLEITFYRLELFWKALYTFLCGFLCCLGLWLVPRAEVHGALRRGGLRRYLYAGGWGLALLGEGLLIAGIVMRCLIRGRPPVTTPYEAILFIVAVGVLVVLFIEYLRRNGFALGLASALGALGMQVANWHEGVEKADTMQPLVAVLDTNFWLSTHVTTVTLGYCAGILAAFVAHVYIFAKLFGYRAGNTAFFTDLSRIIYGILCFGLLFSVVGTILGGVWANDSWGRFWGWDPKENGALMLCLGYITILHARMGGYLRQHGIAVASVLIGIIVMWAFWGVNLYQVGLHSYGFSDKKAAATNLYYAVEYAVAGLGIAAFYIDRARLRRRVAASGAA